MDLLIIHNYSTTLNFYVFLLVEIDHMTRQCLLSVLLSAHSARFWQFSVKKLLAFSPFPVLIIRNKERVLKWLPCTRQSPWGLSRSIFRDKIITWQLSPIFVEILALYNKNNRVLLSQALCAISSLGNLIFKLHISPRTTFSG